MSNKRRGGRASQALTRLVIATYGDVCWLQLPGCTRKATTKDHVTPFSRGGSDALDNLRPACKPCNSKRQNKSHGAGSGARVKVITGPPGAGKSTYVRDNAGPLDVVIDLDQIAHALMATPPESIHSYPQHIKHVAIGARKAAIDRAVRLQESVTVWLIHSVPSPDQLTEYQRLHYEIVTIDPGRAEVMQRVYEQRPGASMEGVERWYNAQDAAQPSDGLLLAPSRDW